MIIDAHQHVWDLERSPYPWLGSHLPHCHRTFTFEELRPQLRAHGVDGTVLVQSDDHDADTRLMLEVAERHPEVLGVVVYVPLDRPDLAAERLAAYRGDPRVVGVRTLVHDQPDPDWILRPEVERGLRLVEQADLVFDLVAALPRHLEHVPVLARRHPGLRLVVDHLGKPPLGRSDREPWWSLVAAAAASSPLVFAKVSGLYPAAQDEDDGAAEVRPFVDRALEVFGPSRLMYGGDWPISEESGGYAPTFRRLGAALSCLSPDERQEVYAGTATRCYRLPTTGADAPVEAAR